MDARAYIEEHRDEFLSSLEEWLRIPSISSDPEHHDDVHASADWLADHLRATGFPTVEVWQTSGLPAVFAEWPAADPDAPTVLVYGHHDVQPVDPVEAWETEPFTPTLRGTSLYARGASDDKGQVLFHALGVRAALAVSGADAPPVTVKMLIEGEEESGSVHFADLMRDHRDRLDCDTVVISDTTMWSADVPSMCVGMRGVTDVQIDLHGPDRDLHSGSFGGAVPNPLKAMSDLLSALHDDDNHITVPGFYDGVVEATDEERELISRLPFDEKEWLATAASAATWGEQGYSTLERIWLRPTAEINGMWGGHIGEGRKTIVPASAHAKVSFRLVPGQDPEKVHQGVQEFVAANTPAGLRAETDFSGPGTRACASDLTSPALKAARSAMEQAFDKEVLFTREGGSGPEADIAEILDAPLVFVAVGLDEDRIHAPNEKVEVPLLLKGAESAAHLWRELGRRP